ncbi:hypothetical protein PI125_g8722 [Phytophthora idaei]|nr:hypothetical protein PI125_g8722 [Phytophthora idaei]
MSVELGVAGEPEARVLVHEPSEQVEGCCQRSLLQRVLREQLPRCWGVGGKSLLPACVPSGLLRSWSSWFGKPRSLEALLPSASKTFADGVLAPDIDAFFNFIRAENVPLDYDELFKVYQDKSMLLMEKAVRGLPPGYYIVHAAEDASSTASR